MKLEIYTTFLLSYKKAFPNISTNRKKQKKSETWKIFFFWPTKKTQRLKDQQNQSLEIGLDFFLAETPCIRTGLAAEEPIIIFLWMFSFGGFYWKP